MTNIIMMPNQRAIQILRLLSEHGPMTVTGLQATIKPPIHANRLRESLGRLHAKRLLTKRFDRVFGNAAVYHQIAQDEDARNLAAQLIGVPPETLSQPHFRHQVLKHAQDCAVWAEKLKRLLPAVRIIREHEFWRDAEISERMQAGERDFDLRPDLMLVARPAVAGARTVLVAFECERTRKTHERLRLKLKKYAAQSSLDGVIYICPEGIGERLGMIYNSKVLEHSPRIKHYGKNFLLLSSGQDLLNADDPKLYNAAKEAISLKKWIHELISTPDELRRDKDFRRPGDGTWPPSELPWVE